MSALLSRRVNYITGDLMEHANSKFSALMMRFNALEQADRYRQVFGAATHGYIFGPPLREEEISGFEGEHQVTLPNEYRSFLKEIGNGGAGPFYGLQSLKPYVQDHYPENHVTISDADGNELASSGTSPRDELSVPSSMARPFLLTDQWSPLDGPYPHEGTPWDGCIELAQQGCGYFDFLVLNGPNAGQVWSDYTAGDGSIVKSADSFIAWLERWIDGAEYEWIEKETIDVFFTRENVDYLKSLKPKLEAVAQEGKWVAGIRMLGYLRLIEGDYDAAKSAFKRAAFGGDEEIQARRELDLARTAICEEAFEEGLKHTMNGRVLDGVWASTANEIKREQVFLFETLKRNADAYVVLKSLAENSYFTFEDHFQLAWRQLSDGKTEDGLKTLDRLVEDNIGPNRHTEKTTKEMVIQEFLSFLEAIDRSELAVHVQPSAV